MDGKIIYNKKNALANKTITKILLGVEYGQICQGPLGSVCFQEGSKFKITSLVMGLPEIPPWLLLLYKDIALYLASLPKGLQLDHIAQL